MDSSPTIVNGLVYVASTDHKIYALNVSTGSLLEAFTTDDGIDSSPAIVNGILYIGSRDTYLYALGELQATTPPGFSVSILIIAGARGVFSSWHKYFCLRKLGSRRTNVL